MFRALVVDDEEPILRLMCAMLKIQGFEVRTASSAREAIVLLREESFDLLVTDLRMETPLAGFEVTRFAQTLDPRPAIAVLTAFPVPGPAWKAAGADALYVKGAHSLELCAELEALVQKHMAEPGVPQGGARQSVRTHKVQAPVAPSSSHNGKYV